MEGGGCGDAAPAPVVALEADAAFGFGNAGSSMAGEGGTISLRNAIICAPLIESVVPSKFAWRFESALLAE